MTAPYLQPQLPDLPIRRVEEMGLKELERIRLILRGGSVIEWRRMHFKTWDEVDRFLRLLQIDPTRKHDEPGCAPCSPTRSSTCARPSTTGSPTRSPTRT